jgi:glycosyltransferase involved in cell wall biosynthesis
MKLAYFSPLPPQKSGIAYYSEALLPHLSRFFKIDLWVSGFIPDRSLSKKFRIINYHKSKNRLSALKNYDYIVYNIGNNPEFHAEMYDVFLEYPGHVILHDFVLFFLVTGYFLDFKRDSKGYIREFYENYGNDGIYEVKKLLHGSIPPLEYQNPELYPLIKKIIRTAPGIIVHSDSTKNALLMNGCSPDKIAKINQINYSNMNFTIPKKEQATIKKQFGINTDGLLITSLGYIAPTKRNAQVIKAINDIIASSHINIQYLMVGEGNYINSYLDQNIKKTGFVPPDEYKKLVSCSDIIVNLRYPSMGESSATLLQAMTAGKPCIVSDIAWFSELPDNVVLKIPVDNIDENDELKRSLLLLITDSQRRSDLGKNAQKYVIAWHNPSGISEEIASFIYGGLRSKTCDLEKTSNEITSNRIHELFTDDYENPLFKKLMKKTAERMEDIGLVRDKEKSEFGFFNIIDKIFRMIHSKF